MNIFEKYGGYEAVKQAAVNYKNSGDRVTAAGLELQCLEYRRQHNIFEVGDKVIGSKLFDDRIFEFQYYLPELSMAVISKDGAAIGLNQLRHATPEEIKAGKRLPD